MRTAQSYTVITEPTTGTPHPHPLVRWTKIATAPNGEEEWLVTIAADRAAELEAILYTHPQVRAWDRRP